MRVATIVSLGASAALGLGALVVARVWLPAQAAKAVHGPAPVVAGVPVVVAAGPIPYGEKLQAKDLTVLQLPADAAPPGAFTTVDQVLKQDAGGAPVALTPISAREPLLPAKLSGPGARPTLSAQIGEGMRAYTIGVTETAGGGGHILPGDRVDVVLTRDLANQQLPDGGHGPHLQSDVVIQNVRVLGMDLNADPSSVHPAVAHTATLEVSVQDAERLALATQAGTLSLALRRVGAAEVAPIRPMAVNDLGPSTGAGAAFDGKAVALIPVHRRAPRPKAAGAPPAGASVIVVHGDKRESVTVPTAHFGAGV
ncbi:MAG: Flp pilus assembly protein CpaB [Caulobacteraceae bacterium]